MRGSTFHEAKALGIRGGMPYYQLAENFPGVNIASLSSNYELYGDITRRVMDIIRDASPSFTDIPSMRAFCILDGMDHLDLKKWGEDLSL